MQKNTKATASTSASMAALSTNVFNANVIVSALGYFVDIYDLLLFGIVRVASLKSLGVPPQELLENGVLLINSQMTGLLLGGIFWGVLGDKKGRLRVLFGSIFLYSIANLLNGFVTSVEQYAVLRFVAGFGLAGELGAAITLVTETMSKETRGYGTTVVATIGILGAVAAALVGELFTWQTAFIIGGALGLTLLVLRVSMVESGLFHKTAVQNYSRGNFLMLFSSLPRFLKYLRCILIGVPVWFVVGILITFSPEITRELGFVGDVSAGKAIMWTYLGVSIGDLICGYLSQVLKTRRRVIAVSLVLTASLCAFYIFSSGLNVSQFYILCVALGLATGYWAVFVTVAAEQFGTNMRATATTTVPNFVRGAVVPLTLAFQALRPALGLQWAAVTVGATSLTLASIALYFIPETFGKDLDYLEES